MTMSSEELVAKAAIITGDIAAAGKLQPDQANKFIDFVVQETMLDKNARVVRFKPETHEINKIGLATRVAMPKSEAADPRRRRGITTSKVTLSPQVIAVPFELSDEFLEVNLEEEQVEDHIVQMMARQFANDLEELYINGHALGPAAIENDLYPPGSTTEYILDDYLALFDGWLELSEGANVVDFGGQNIEPDVFSRMLNAMPSKFRRDKRNLRFFCSTELEQRYRLAVSGRATAGGDAALEGMGNLKPFGVELVPAPLLPDSPTWVEHVTLTGTTPASLSFDPIVAGSVIVSTSTLATSSSEAAYVEGTDYSVDLVNGTVTRIASGSIGSGDVVKVTYDTQSQVLLTHNSNFILGIGRDIKVEQGRDIFKGANQWIMTAKVSVQFEELTAIVKGKNIGLL